VKTEGTNMIKDYMTDMFEVKNSDTNKEKLLPKANEAPGKLPSK
jgi:hypothetical protein